jgi:signal transduction histidine kinase
MLNNRQEEIVNRNHYLILKDSIGDLELVRKVEKLQFELQIESKEKENELLKLRQAQTETLVDRQRFVNVLAVFVIAFLSILAVLYWQIGKRRKMLNDKLATQNDQIVSHQHEIDIKNEALSRRNQQLSDINHEKDTIMSIVAHDLKAPLNRISGLAYLLEKEGPLNVNQMTYIQMIRDSTKSGARLIADLLDAHAMEENSNAPSYQDFDLAKLLSDSILYFQVVALEKDIRLEKTLPSTALFTSDPSYINRIVENLVSNAIKFSKVGSSVFLECRIESKNAIIKVRDQRPGFTDTDRLSLYKKFKKLSAKPTSSESSNGLGLAIVKTLIDRLGGTIELISSEGKGSEFVVSIPYIETKS